VLRANERDHDFGQRGRWRAGVEDVREARPDGVHLFKRAAADRNLLDTLEEHLK
jgi:hypothetical protein